MKIPSFIGGTDEQRSNNLSDNKLINLYPTTNNDGSIAAFYKVDGLKSEGTLSGVPTGAYKASNGRAFYTSGTTLYELTVVAGVYTSTDRGTITTATNYEFSDNGLELIMVNGTDGWIFTFSTNTLLQLTVLTGNFTAQAATAVDVDATLTKVAHGLIVGDRVILTTTGSLPTYLLPSTVYYVLADGFTADAFKVGLTLTGATCTISNGTPCTVTSASHNFIAGDKIRFLTTGTLPSSPSGGLTAGTVYYVLSAGITQDTFRISLTDGGAAINTTTAGSGVHSFNPAITIIQPTTGICSISSTSAVGGTCTISYASPAVLTKTAHGLVGGEIIIIAGNPVPGGGSNLPGNIIAGINYYVLAAGLTANTFSISLTDGGTAVNTSSAGVDPQTYYVVPSGYITTTTEHGFSVGDAVMFATTGALPTGLAINTEYFVTGYKNTTFDLGYSAAPVFFSTTSQWLFWSGLRFYSTDTILPGKLGQKIKFKTNGVLPTIISEDVEYTLIATAYSGYYMLTLDGVIVGSSGYTHADTTIPVTTGLGSGSHTYVFSDSFSVVATAPETFGTRVAISGTQSGVHSYFQDSSVAFGTHTYSTGGSGFPNGAKTISYMNGRFIACDPNTQDFYVSEVLDGKTWDAINVQTVDSNPDYVTGQIVAHNELFVFCENSGETYYDSGTTPTPFVRNLTGIFEVGCKAPYTIKEIGGSVIFLGNTNSGNGIVYRLTGLTPVRISTYSIEYQIQQMSDISDARAFTYQKDGHHFYVLTFPTGDKTFVFDASTSLWHERSERLLSYDSTNGTLGAKTDYATGTFPQRVAISSDGKSVYVTNNTGFTVSMYSRNTTTGTLSAKTDYAANFYPKAIAITQDGSSVYVTSTTTDLVSMYARDTITGTLSAKTDYATGVYPDSIAISPDDTSVYVTNYNSGTVSMYSRNTTTGTLSAKTDYAVGTSPNDLEISPDGLYVYVCINSNISAFTRNLTDGTLSAKTDYATSTYPISLVISPDGSSLYVGYGQLGKIVMFARNITTGEISNTTSLEYSAAIAIYDLAISSDGSSIYAANFWLDNVSMFNRNTKNWTLSGRTEYTAGDQPYGVVVSPDGNNVYVTNQNSATISMYSRSISVPEYVDTEWPVNKYLYFNNEHLVTEDTTTLFSIDSLTYQNGTDPIRIVRSFRAPPSDMKRVAHHTIQVDCEVGIGDVLLTEPVIALRWSDDAGNTWSTAIERGLGLVGNYSKSVIFRRLGSTKGLPRIYELSCDENVKITLLDCYLE